MPEKLAAVTAPLAPLREMVGAPLVSRTSREPATVWVALGKISDGVAEAEDGRYCHWGLVAVIPGTTLSSSRTMEMVPPGTVTARGPSRVMPAPAVVKTVTAPEARMEN